MKFSVLAIGEHILLSVPSVNETQGDYLSHATAHAETGFKFMSNSGAPVLDFLLKIIALLQ